MVSQIVFTARLNDASVAGISGTLRRNLPLTSRRIPAGGPYRIAQSEALMRTAAPKHKFYFGVVRFI
jgi:hypothetical protein